MARTSSTLSNHSSPAATRSWRFAYGGVTLLDVLVVCGIVVLLLALLVPSLGSAREQARRVVCGNNLRQWGYALQCYRHECRDFIPTVGTFLNGGILKSGTWFNELPPYLDAPAYRDIDGVNVAIKEMRNGNVWICPSKAMSEVSKSTSGKNQFHYGMNQVLDGMGKAPLGSNDTPGFPDPPVAQALPAKRFARMPHTLFLFDIAPNSPAGSPRDVATEFTRGFQGEYLGRFHGDYANFLYVDGGLTHARTADIVAQNDFRHGAVHWKHPDLYWGYPPPTP